MSAPAATRPYRQVARAAATEDTRQRIITAFIGALEAGWIEDITLDDIAAEAGTTRQTVIRLFGNKDALLAAGAQRMGEEVLIRRAILPGAGPRAVTQALLRDYEESGDRIIRLLAQEGRYPPMSALLDYGRAEHRAWVAACFAPELSALAPLAREALLDKLVVVTDVFTWKLLRHDRKRSAAEVETLMTSLIAGVLQEGKQQNA